MIAWGLEWHSVAALCAYISLIKLKLFDEWNFNVPHFRFSSRRRISFARQLDLQSKLWKLNFAQLFSGPTGQRREFSVMPILGNERRFCFYQFNFNLTEREKENNAES